MGMDYGIPLESSVFPSIYPSIYQSVALLLLHFLTVFWPQRALPHQEDPAK